MCSSLTVKEERLLSWRPIPGALPASRVQLFANAKAVALRAKSRIASQKMVLLVRTCVHSVIERACRTTNRRKEKQNQVQIDRSHFLNNSTRQNVTEFRIFVVSQKTEGCGAGETENQANIDKNISKVANAKSRGNKWQ